MNYLILLFSLFMPCNIGLKSNNPFLVVKNNFYFSIDTGSIIESDKEPNEYKLDIFLGSEILLDVSTGKHINISFNENKSFDEGKPFFYIEGINIKNSDDWIISLNNNNVCDERFLFVLEGINNSQLVNKEIICLNDINYVNNSTFISGIYRFTLKENFGNPNELSTPFNIKGQLIRSIDLIKEQLNPLVNNK